MATGANIQPRRDNGVTANTPSVDLRDGSADMWRSVGRLAEQLGETETANYRRIAERRGAEEGAAVAAGTMEAPRPRNPLDLLSGGQVFEARQAAFETSYLSGVANDVDGQEAEIRRRFSHDVQGYEAAMTDLRSGVIKSAVPEHAVAVESYINRRLTVGRSAVADAAQSVAMREAQTEVATRQNLLSTRLTSMLRDGQDQTPEFQFIKDERDQLIQQRLANPAIPYTQAEADADELEFVTAGKAALYTRDAVETLRTEGPDAAIAMLQEILTDPAIGATERQTVFESARAAINQEIDVAADRTNLANASRTRREQEMTRRIEDDAAAIEIGAPGTGLTEAEVLAVSGPSGVADWRRKQAEASERNRLTGDLVGLPRDEAIARARQALAGAEGTVADLNDPLKTPTEAKLPIGTQTSVWKVIRPGIWSGSPPAFAAMASRASFSSSNVMGGGLAESQSYSSSPVVGGSLGGRIVSSRSGNGRWSAFASSHGARIQTVISCRSLRERQVEFLT